MGALRLRYRHGATSFGVSAAVLVIVAAGCDDGAMPLGGPYGGTRSRVAPNDGGYDNVDATISPKPATTGGNGGGQQGTWTGIFNRYLAAGTSGNCTTCHAEMSSPSAAFQWLEQDGYVGGPDPLLTSNGASCLSWFGGDMPPGAPTPNADAVTELTAWAAAGATND
jgi:hypothetical protein